MWTPFVPGLHDALTLTPDDNPSIWKHLTNMPLLVVVFSIKDVSTLFLVTVAVCRVLSIALVLCHVPPSLKIEETMVGFASREL